MAHQQVAQTTCAIGQVLSSALPIDGMEWRPANKHCHGETSTNDALHCEMRYRPEVIVFAGADVHAVLQWHVDVHAARSCTPISTHLRPDAPQPAMAAPHLHCPCTGLQQVYAWITVATQSEPAARTASVVGCMNGAHAAQLLGCTRAEPASSKAAAVSMINHGQHKSRSHAVSLHASTTHRSCCCQWHLLPADATRTPPLHLVARVLGCRPGWTAAPCWALKALLQPLTSYRTQRALLWHMPQFTKPDALQAVCWLRAAALAGFNRFCSDYANCSCKHPKGSINMQFSCDGRITTGNHVHACRMRMPPLRLC